MHTAVNLARRPLLFASLACAALLAACSSDKVTAPSAPSLARIFDSAFVADTAGGRRNTLRPQLELALARVADQGVTPITVKLTTANGTLSMLMMALSFYDTTASGTAADSNVNLFGWTSDYQQYLLLVYSVNIVSAGTLHRTGSNDARATLALPGPWIARHARAESSLSSGLDDAVVVDGDSVVADDSTTGNISSSPASGHCAWQHVIQADSAESCSRATITTNFTFFFPIRPGVDTSLMRITMPSEAIPAIRLLR